MTGCLHELRLTRSFGMVLPIVISISIYGIFRLSFFGISFASSAILCFSFLRIQSQNNLTQCHTPEASDWTMIISMVEDRANGILNLELRGHHDT
jgi:hypothetical protein